MKTIDVDRLWSRHAEASVLGSAMLDPRCIPTLVEILSANDFFDEAHHVIWSAITETWKQVGPDLDAQLVRATLEASKRLESIGGVAYLKKIIESVPTASNARYYAGLVREKSQYRQAIGKAEQIRQGLALEVGNDKVVENVRSLLTTLTPDQPESGDIVQALTEIIEQAIAGTRQVISTPWPVLDRLTAALMPETVTLVCGNIGASKSYLMLQLVATLIERKVPTAIYEFEEDRRFWAMRFLAQRCMLPDLVRPDWQKANPDLSRRAIRENTDFLRTVGKRVWCVKEQPNLDHAAAWIEDRAREGYRVLILDPVTSLAHVGRDTPAEDNAFLTRLKQAAVKHGGSIVVVTHPVKLVSLPDIGQLAGGSCYGRFSQTILWLESHQPKGGTVKAPCGTIETEWNRTLHVLKARNDRGSGLQLAMQFRGEDLKLAEIGIISKEQKNKGGEDA